MELFILYLWLKLNVISGFIAGCGVFIFIITIIPIIYHALTEDNLWPKAFRNLSIVATLILVSNLIPSKTDTAILVGAHYALKVAETPEAAKVMTLLRQKANDLLDEELNKTSKKVEQK